MSIRHVIFTVVTATALLSGLPAAQAAERSGNALERGMDGHLQTVGSGRGQHGDRHGGNRDRADRHGGYRDRGDRHGSSRHYGPPRHHAPSRYYAPRWRGGWDPWARPYYPVPRYYGGYALPGYAPYYYRPRPVYPLYPYPYGPGWSFSFGWNGY